AMWAATPTTAYSSSWRDMKLRIFAILRVVTMSTLPRRWAICLRSVWLSINRSQLSEDSCMRREYKTPTATPASKLTDKGSAHFKWVQRNGAKLVRSALDSYRINGRGAFIIREEDAKPSGTAARYLSVRGARATGAAWPGPKTAQMVHTYDPTQQFVIVFLYRSGVANSYVIRFGSANNLTVIEST